MKEFEKMLKNGDFPLVVSLPFNKVELAKAAWENGADVVKVHINVDHQASGTHFGSFEEEKENLKEMLAIAKGPMGIVVGGDIDSADRDLEKVIELGFDFISLYGTNTSFKVMSEDRVSKMLAPKSDWSLEEIAHMKDFGTDILEASIFTYEGPEYRPNQKTWIDYKILSEVSKLPILVPTQHNIKPEEVEALKFSGVSGIMIGAVVMGKQVDTIAKTTKEFREAIDAMKAKKNNACSCH